MSFRKIVLNGIWFAMMMIATACVCVGWPLKNIGDVFMTASESLAEMMEIIRTALQQENEDRK
jgi:spore maturation protein SpmA